MLKSLRKIKNEVVCPPKVGEIVEGKMLNRGRSSLFLDLGAKGIGIIYGQEFFQAKETLKNLEPGDTLLAKVTDMETDDGYRELSITEAAQELAWDEIIKAKETGEVFEVQIKGANKGGLVCEVRGIPGFIPTSQLLPEHYPKVEGAEPSKIAAALQNFLGQKFKIKIFDVNIRERKLILSEKATGQEKAKQELGNYKIDEIVEGEVSGITNFGAFLKFGKGLEGLIRAEKTTKALKLGQKIKAKIIEIANDRIYLKVLSKNSS